MAGGRAAAAACRCRCCLQARWSWSPLHRAAAARPPEQLSYLHPALCSMWVTAASSVGLGERCCCYPHLGACALCACLLPVEDTVLAHRWAPCPATSASLSASRSALRMSLAISGQPSPPPPSVHSGGLRGPRGGRCGTAGAACGVRGEPVHLQHMLLGAVSQRQPLERCGRLFRGAGTALGRHPAPQHHQACLASTLHPPCLPLHLQQIRMPDVNAAPAAAQTSRRVQPLRKSSSGGEQGISPPPRAESVDEAQ